MDLQNLKRNKMEQKITCIKAGILALLLMGCAGITKGQATLYEEDFGTPTSNTPVQYYAGWQDTTVQYVGNGTCDIRSSNASTGYGGASGGGNVMINDTSKWFQISGLNTTAPQTTVKLYCGLRKTSAENGSNFVVEFSTDSIVWVELPMSDTLPTGSGTGGWHRVCYPNVPAYAHLHLRFSSRVNVDYRLDDIRITDGDEVVLETVETPTCTPPGGTYYEPQQVTLTCSTSGAAIHYTIDGSTPTTQSPVCAGILDISGNCTLKAFATHDNMYNSGVMTAQYTILDTLSLVELPFDISDNSVAARVDIKTLPGFRSNKLGSSYADGSVKYETKNAGSAALIAHLDRSPGELSFELKGVKSGNPSAYSGITFLISESVNGQLWTTVAALNESDIGLEGFQHFGPYSLSGETRYLRWMLASATSGNTQLNNIAITALDEGGDDSTGLVTPEVSNALPHPNPARNFFRWDLCEEATTIGLYDGSGRMARQWTNVTKGESLDLKGLPSGHYILRAKTLEGTIAQKIIIRP